MGKEKMLQMINVQDYSGVKLSISGIFFPISFFTSLCKRFGFVNVAVSTLKTKL